VIIEMEMEGYRRSWKELMEGHGRLWKELMEGYGRILTCPGLAV
jgi:hypothetical protein